MNPEEQHILIVDDDSLAVELLVEQMAQLGFVSIRHAGDGAAALALIDETPNAFDFLLCDLNMPTMDGVELLRHLTQRQFEGGVVLMAEANGHLLESVESLGRLHALRMLGTLRKPVSGQALWKVLGHHIDLPTRREIGIASVLEITPDELERALGQGKLSLYYQPQVDVLTESIVGVESLVRWNHPRLGLVSPVRFIAQAEHLGLIDRLTERVFMAAIAQAAEWRAAGIALDVSVNVSMQNLQTLSLPDALFALAQRFGLPLDCLTLELNESQLVTNPASVLEILARLRMKGLGLAIDDFGTGYADLEHLSQLPFTELKIGRSFIVNAFHKTAAMAILKNTVSLAKRLGLKVVAEGVETEQQWELVKQIGCDLAQGYYIARPMSADQLVACLTHWNETTHTIKTAYDQALRAQLV
jgi:EAL domain-containing protein (putative c-di-GMP-specific phosphodiesterase class I)